MDEADDVLFRRALKAAREKARRSRINPDYRPREASTAVRLRREGISSDAHYSRLRRERLKADRDRDGNACHPTTATNAAPHPLGDGVSCLPALTDPRDGVSCSGDDPALHVVSKIGDGVPCRLSDDRVSDGDISDGRVSDGDSCSPWSPETANLLRRVRRLPGGRDPAFLDSLARLVANAPAARTVWGDCDPELAALLAAND